MYFGNILFLLKHKHQYISSKIIQSLNTIITVRNYIILIAITVVVLLSTIIYFY